MIHTVYGGAGDDLILEGRGADLLFGGTGNDEIRALDDAFVEADIVDGGDGDDTMIVDAGDTVTGGNGADLLFVDHGNAAPEAPVIIIDFDTGEDLLAITYGGTGPIELSFDDTRGAVIATGPDTVLAVLQGLSAEDIPDITMVDIAL